MRSVRTWFLRSLFALVAASFPLLGRAARAEDPPASPPKDDPGAHALYDGMNHALREAESLALDGRFTMQMGGFPETACRFRMELRKPNFFRVEVLGGNDEPLAVLVGDGETAWTWWPAGRPLLGMEDMQIPTEERTKQFMKEPAPPGRHSISHLTAMLGYNLSMLVADPSVFHGYTDTLQPLLDGVTPLGEEEIDGEACVGVRVSYMDGQRVWELWLAKADRLPRRMRETIHAQRDIVKVETWSNLALGAAIPEARFAWTPPEGWTEFRLPEPESLLLAAGTPAPDFDLALADGGRFKLSEQRGKVVWLVFWRVG